MGQREAVKTEEKGSLIPERAASFLQQSAVTRWEWGPVLSDFYFSIEARNLHVYVNSHDFGS